MSGSFVRHLQLQHFLSCGTSEVITTTLSDSSALLTTASMSSPLWGTSVVFSALHPIINSSTLLTASLSMSTASASTPIASSPLTDTLVCPLPSCAVSVSSPISSVSVQDNQPSTKPVREIPYSIDE